MHARYLLAGTITTNPLLFILATILALAWRTAGYWGLDRWVLPRAGVPGSPGPLSLPRRHDSAVVTSCTSSFLPVPVQPEATFDLHGMTIAALTAQVAMDEAEFHSSSRSPPPLLTLAQRRVQRVRDMERVQL